MAWEPAFNTIVRDYIPSWRLKHLDPPQDLVPDQPLVFSVPGTKREVVVKMAFNFFGWAATAYFVEILFVFQKAAWTSRYPWKMAWPFPLIVGTCFLLFNAAATFRWEWRLVKQVLGREILVERDSLKIAACLSRWKENKIIHGYLRNRRFSAADAPYFDFPWGEIERFKVGFAAKGRHSVPAYRIKTKSNEDDLLFERMVTGPDEIRFLDIVAEKLGRAIVLDAGTSVFSDR